jgi:hypothetical protein
MPNKLFIKVQWLTVFLICFSTLSVAEQKIETIHYIVHYNAFNSTAIDSEAAKKNQLIRSKYTAMLNLSILKKESDGTTLAVKSFNAGTVENLLGQQQTLKFKTIDEGQAIYYIASFRFADQEQMNFSITVQPDPNIDPINIKLSQKFFAD